MAGKSRNAKGKRSFQSKKKRSRQHLPVTAASQPAADQAIAPAISREASFSSTGVPVPKTAPAVMKYPYIGAELRRIGILAVIVLVILIILAVVLPSFS